MVIFLYLYFCDTVDNNQLGFAMRSIDKSGWVAYEDLSLGMFLWGERF
jgi:hypothetical protein